MTRPPHNADDSAQDRLVPRSDAERADASQPLAAAWSPEPLKRPRHRLNRARRYGWRMYALPLMVVVTVLAVFQTLRPGDVDAALSGSRHPLPPPHQPARVQHPPAAPPAPLYPASMFDADLPPGGPIPQTGTGTFVVLPGTSPVLGQGRLYRYTVEVEAGMNRPDLEADFGRLVPATLADPRSWTNPKSGLSLQRVDQTGPQPDVRVTLVSQDTARALCGYSEGVPYDSSCRRGERVYINAARWVRGAKAFEGDMDNYRRYAINHEVGHAFGNGHVGCPAPGVPAPVMMQQSFSVSNNVLHQLNQVADQGTKIPANGFVCQPNAWPFPDTPAPPAQ